MNESSSEAQPSRDPDSNVAISSDSEGSRLSPMEKVALEEGQLPQWAERLGDRFNPILVKEVRRTLKSRFLIVAFGLLLLSCWGISVFGSLLVSESMEFGSPSLGFFSAFYFVLAVAVFLVIPFSSFQGLHGERSGKTYEVLSISSLSPRQIVWGQFSTAMVQVALYFFGIAPFIAFTALLQGFDPPVVGFILLATLLFSPLLCMTTLMISSLGWSSSFRTILMLGILGILFWIMMGAISIANSILYFRGLPFADAGFWWTMLFITVIGISYFFLFEQIAVMQLAFQSGKSSTGIRIVGFFQFLILWAAMIIAIIVQGWTWRVETVVFVCTILSGIHLAVFGVFIVAEPDTLSRRTHRKLPQSRFLRFLMMPFLTGGTRALLYILMQGILLILVVAFIQFTFAKILTSSTHTSVSVANQELWIKQTASMLAAYCFVAYLGFYLGIGSFMTRFFSSMFPGYSPAFARVMIVIMLSAFLMLPYFSNMAYALLTGQRNSGSPDESFVIMLFSPIENLIALSEYIGRHSGYPNNPLNFLNAFVKYTLLLTFGILLNLRAISVGMVRLFGEMPARQDHRTTLEIEELAIGNTSN